MTNDTPDMHFCHPCHLIIHKALTMSYGENYKHRTSAYDGHVEGSCRVFEHYSKLHRGGRPKTYRPSTISQPQNAPAPLVEPATTISIRLLTFSAPLPTLLRLLLSLIELITCGSLVCAQRCCRWLNHCTQLTCPCCYHPHITDFSTIRH